MDSIQRSLEFIKKYLGKQVLADLDGIIFDDQPSQFAFRFCDPAELRDAIAEMYCDEMGMEPWSEVVPVAAVSAPERSSEEFAWIFLDWRHGGDAPAVIVATHDNWGGELCASGLDKLDLRIV